MYSAALCEILGQWGACRYIGLCIVVLLFILICRIIQASEWWKLALLALLARLAVQKLNVVVTKSCFIVYIKVLDTSCFRRVTFGTLWELARTKINFHCKLSLPPFDSKLWKSCSRTYCDSEVCFWWKTI